MSVWAILHFVIATANPHLTALQVKEFARYDVRAADAFGVSPLLLASLVDDESRWHPEVAGRGFIGLGQVGLSNYPKRHRPDLRDPRINLHESARWLAAWRKRCGSDPRKYVGGYQGAGCAPSKATSKILARWTELELMRGWRRLSKGETTPQLVRHARAILDSSAPLGSVVKFREEGKLYAGIIELHEEPGHGPHRGVSLLGEAAGNLGRRIHAHRP